MTTACADADVDITVAAANAAILFSSSDIVIPPLLFAVDGAQAAARRTKTSAADLNFLPQLLHIRPKLQIEERY
jgi:hypothetical protein